MPVRTDGSGQGVCLVLVVPTLREPLLSEGGIVLSVVELGSLRDDGRAWQKPRVTRRPTLARDGLR
jgi:hypothetical protein